MRSSRLLLLAACALLAPAAAAQADATADFCPAPGLVATDATGDQTFMGQPVAGSNDLDLTTVLLGSNAYGGGRVTLNIPTLDKTVPPYAAGLAWRLDYTVDGTARYVTATLKSNGNVEYMNGVSGSGLQTAQKTTGTYTTGTPGRIIIDLPDVQWGDELTAMHVWSTYVVGVENDVTGVTTDPRSDDVAIAGTTTLPVCQVPPDDGSDQ